MAAEIIATILSVIKELVGLKSDFEAVARNHQDHIADYLIQIRDCLQRVVDELKVGQVPHGACAELATCAVRVPEILGGVVADAETQRLAFELASTHDVESVAAKLQTTGKGPLEAHSLN
jgi:hypothetical protein